MENPPASSALECLHATVHHVARRDKIDAGTRLRHRDLPEQID